MSGTPRENAAEIMRSLGRLETMAEATQREIAELKHETRVRLNTHSGDLRSRKQHATSSGVRLNVGGWQEF